MLICANAISDLTRLMLKGIKWCSRHFRRLVLNSSMLYESILSSLGDLRALVRLRLLRKKIILASIASAQLNHICHTIAVHWSPMLTLCPTTVLQQQE